MGVTLGTRQVPRDLGELHRKVGELVDLGAVEQPAELPYYVKNPDDDRMPAGWYWRPASSPTPLFLGTNVFRALRALDRLR